MPSSHIEQPVVRRINLIYLHICEKQQQNGSDEKSCLNNQLDLTRNAGTGRKTCPICNFLETSCAVCPPFFKSSFDGTIQPFILLQTNHSTVPENWLVIDKIKYEEVVKRKKIQVNGHLLIHFPQCQSL